jgi:hypothetical protein
VEAVRTGTTANNGHVSVVEPGIASGTAAERLTSGESTVGGAQSHPCSQGAYSGSFDDAGEGVVVVVLEFGLDRFDGGEVRGEGSPDDVRVAVAVGGDPGGAVGVGSAEEAAPGQSSGAAELGGETVDVAAETRLCGVAGREVGGVGPAADKGASGWVEGDAEPLVLGSAAEVGAVGERSAGAGELGDEAVVTEFFGLLAGAGAVVEPPQDGSPGGEVA